MMELYEKSIYDIQRYIQWPEINLEEEHLIPFSFFQNIDIQRSRQRFKQRKWYQKNIFKNLWLSFRWSILIITLSCINLWLAWKNSKSAIMPSMLRKIISSILEKKRSWLNMKLGANIFRRKGDKICTIIVKVICKIL